jgi:hypothetical protein
MVAGSDEGRRTMSALTTSPKIINHPASNACADEYPDKHAEPPAVIQVATNEADHSTSYSRD